MKSHTGGVLTLGKGTIYGSSTRQKLNTKSSTEAELVAVNDLMPQVLWTKYFLEAQGYNTGASIVYQDNQSTMLLGKNGRASSEKKTRHIDIRYFFITNHIASGEFNVQYCPTADMIADYFTKRHAPAHHKRVRSTYLYAPPPTAHNLQHRHQQHQNGNNGNDNNYINNDSKGNNFSSKQRRRRRDDDVGGG